MKKIFGIISILVVLGLSPFSVGTATSFGLFNAAEIFKDLALIFLLICGVFLFIRSGKLFVYLSILSWILVAISTLLFMLQFGGITY
ncbi:MAG: hypothetical protein AAB784_01975 [Patescibacteria group bacterium]